MFCVFLHFFCRSVKKGIQVLQNLKMKTIYVYGYILLFLFYYYLEVLVLLARCIVKFLF